MTAVTPGQPEDEESIVQTALERGLHRQALDDLAFARVRRSVHAEFLSQYGHVARRRRSNLLRVASIAAALVGLTVISAVLFFPKQEGAVVGSLAHLQNGGLRTSPGFFRHHDLAVGEAVHVGERATSSGTSLIALSEGGVMRVAPGAEFEGADPREVVLQAGRVFLDFPSGAGKFVVRTPVGTIEHVGTQFEVSVGESETRIRVREGSVRMQTLADTQLVEAGIEALVTEAGLVTRREIPTYGPDWAWVETIAPEFDIENRELIEVLGWVARETGRHIEFADERAREVATHTRLHGSVRGLPPLEALGQVLSTTSLRFEVHDNVIRVSSHR